MKVYKGTNKDMQCTPGGKVFQYEQGVTYEKPKAELCAHGFHACEAPLDVLDYYAPGEGSRYFEAELEDVSPERREDSKVCGEKITLGAEIGIPGLVKAHIEYVKAHTTTEHTDPKQATAGSYGAATAGDRGAATAGDSGAATAGYRGAATAGDSGAATAGESGAATAGSYGAATAGDRGAATAGDSGAATAGYRGAATAGYRGAATAGSYGAATAGSYGAATSRGSSASGANGLSVARGNNVRVKGGLGAVLVIVEEEPRSYEIKEWKAAVVDGDAIKPDTWYTLKDGEFVEAGI